MAEEHRPSKLRRVAQFPEGSGPTRSSESRAFWASLQRVIEDVTTLAEANDKEEAELAADPLREQLRKVLAEGVPTVAEAPSLDPNSIVVLNVGGDTRFATRRGTLTCLPQSRLGRIFRFGWDNFLPRDPDGKIFLDLDPDQFRLCMDWAAKVEKLCLEDPLPPHPFEHDCCDQRKEELSWLHRCLTRQLGIPDKDRSGKSDKVADLVFAMAADDDGASCRLQGCVSCNESLVLTPALAAIIEDLRILKKPSFLKLLYRASRDGHSPDAFHQRCDRRSPILVMVKSSGGFVFGGYTERQWNLVEADLSACPVVFCLGGPGNTRPHTCVYRNERSFTEIFQDRAALRFSFPSEGGIEVSIDLSSYQPPWATHEDEPPFNLTLAEGDRAQVIEWEVFHVEDARDPVGAFTRLQQELRQHEGATIGTHGSTMVEGLQEMCGRLAQWHSALRDSRLSPSPQRHQEELSFLHSICGRGCEGTQRSDIVSLNVRGHIMMTFKSTLEHSQYFASELSGRWKVEKGMLLIDHDPELFGLLLRALRMDPGSFKDDGDDESFLIFQWMHPWLGDKIPLEFHRKALFDELARFFLMRYSELPSLASGILGRSEEKQLEESGLLAQIGSGLPKLLFRGTRDGFSAQKFHELCDDKGPTLVLIKHEAGVVGGVTEAAWDCSGTFKRSEKVKVFEIEPPDYESWFRLSERSLDQPEQGIYCHKDFGPCLGQGDLKVCFRGDGAWVPRKQTSPASSILQPTWGSSMLVAPEHLLQPRWGPSTPLDAAPAQSDLESGDKVLDIEVFSW